MAEISVVVPVYKVEPYIRRCIDSILRQSFTSFDVILIDDGSPDKSGAICDEYAAKDNRVHVIHQENGGLSSARNSGIDWAIRNSDSSFITFIDSDDWVCSSYLEKLYKLVNEDVNVQIAVCDFTRSTEEKDISKSYQSGKTSFGNYYEIKGLPHVNAWGKLIDKNFFCRIRFPEGKLYEDLYIMHKVIDQAAMIAYTYEPLYIYELNEESITASSWTPRHLDEIQACEEFIRFMKKSENPSGIIYGKGYYCSILEKQISEIENLQDSSYNEIKKVLYRKFRFALLRYYRFVPRHASIWFYQKAFPHISWIYWSIYGIIKKVECLLQRNR